MTTAVAAAFPELTRAETAVFEGCLLRAASWFGTRSAPIARVRRRPLDGTWYRTEAVTAETASGARVRCFVKDFGTFVAEKSRMTERRDREVSFYRDVFAGGELGLARCAGIVAGPGGPWLVLEHLDAVPLRWCSIDVWHEAAAWLGRFHAAITRRAAPLPPVFKHRDGAYFDAALARARAGADLAGPDARARVEAAADFYPAAVHALLAQPQTLVHGAFRPDQVLVDTTPVPPRVCPVDWEIAGIGSCLYDLAVLTDGFDESERARFFERYVAETPWRDLTAADLAAASIACRMHRTMKWIGHAHVRGMGPDAVRALAESLPVADGAPT